MNNYNDHKGHWWRYVVSCVVLVLTLAFIIALLGCAEEGAPPPGEEEAPAAGVGIPSEEEPVAEGVPAEEGPVGEGVPAEGEPTTQTEEEPAAGEAATTPSPEAANIDIELEVDSTNPEGVKFIAPESGSYEITIVGGASIHLPKTDPNWPVYGGWRTILVLYINKLVEWGNPTEWGPRPINFHHKLGSDETYPAPAEAEAANQGASVTVHLDEGDYIIALESDEQDYYYDNSGIIKIRIAGP